MLFPPRGIAADLRVRPSFAGECSAATKSYPQAVVAGDAQLEVAIDSRWHNAL